MSEFDVSSLHPEIGCISSLSDRGLALHSDFTNWVCLNLVSKADRLCSNIISSGLKELDISWPWSFAIIPEDPSFGKFNTWLNFVLVSDTLFDKTSLIPWVLRLCNWCLFLRSYWLLFFLFLDKADFRWKCLAHLNVLVLADKFCRSVFWLSNLKQAVTSMNTVTFTIFAEIKIWTDWAHVTDSFNRCHTASVADKVLMDNVSLFKFLLFQEILKHALECFVTIVTDFPFYSLGNGSKFFWWKNSSATTFPAW
jgi:hypothetical protein